jgi:hypothetical protein
VTRDIPLVGVSLSPYVQPNTDWYARSVLKSNANTPTSTTPTSLFQSITGRTYSFKTRRGRTYDLGRTEAGTLDLRVDNSDGALNPLVSGNNLYPFCPARVTAAYPTTGNILNDTNKGYIGEVTAVVTAASGSGGFVTYTCNNTFQVGQQVSVTGLSILNLSAQIVVSASATQFTVSNAATGSTTNQVGTASLDLPATWADSSISVCANDSNFELGVISNWYNILGTPAPTVGTTGGHTSSNFMSLSAGNTYLLDVPVVAGKQLTVSLWYKSGSSSTLKLFDGGWVNNGTTATASVALSISGSWTQFSATYTSTAPKLTLAIVTGGACFVDDVRVEFGSVVTTNANSPTIYNLFNGFVERFPQSFQAPNRGEVNMTATDAVSLMSQNSLVNPYAALAVQDANTYLYFPFNEANSISVDVYSSFYSSGVITYRSLNSFVVGDYVTVTGMGANSVENKAVTFSDGVTFKVSATGSGTVYGAGVATATRVYSQSGNSYANTTAVGYTTGSGTITLGEQNTLAGFNGDSNIAFKTTSASDVAEVTALIPVTAQVANFMVDVWVKWSTAGTFLNLGHASGATTTVGVTSGGFLTATRSGTGTVTQSGTNNKFQTGVWRLVRIYYDGTNLNIGMADYDSTTATSVYGFTFNTLAVPSTNVTSFTLGSILSGFVGSCAAFRYGLYSSTNQGSAISKNLFQVGWTGYSGAKTGSRFADVMQNYSGFNYTPIAADLGVNHSGVMNLANRTLQDVVQITSDTEQGYWYVDGAGFVTFKDQTHRKYTTPNLSPVKFADNATDTQYDGTSIVVNYDLTFVYNQVTVTCNGSMFYAEDATSINRYFPRTLNIATENAYPSEVSTLATSLLNKYKSPAARLETITFTPVRNPSTWGALLGLEVGDFVQVTRTPLGATAITFKGWVEQIEHEFDAQSADWLTHITVSPHLPTS